MARSPLCIAATLFVLMAVAQPASAQPRIGDLAPVALGKTLDGTSVMVSDNQGKVMAVTFWASWCAPCKAELPVLEGLQRVAGSDRIRVVAVNMEDAVMFRRVARSLSQLQLTLTHDSNSEISAAYGVRGIPHMVIIGRDGRILKVHRGYNETHLDQIVADVNAALATK
jgi:thiol-disulfide isomerase/thioredoxin